MQRLARNLFNVDREETDGLYLHYRLFEFVIVWQIIWIAWKWAPYIDRLSTVVLPLGLADYVEISFMFQSPFAMINAALMTFFALLGFFNRWKYSYLVTLLLFHLHYISRFSQGEISHSSHFTGVATLALAVAAIAYWNSGTKRRRAAFGWTIFFIGLGYTSAALCKLVATGPTWVDGSHMWIWMGERSIDVISEQGSFSFNTLQQLAMDHWIVATAILTVGITTEFIGFTMWFRKIRPYTIILLLGMHIGIEMTMNIAFPLFLYILAVIGFPWHRVFDYVLDRMRASRDKVEA